MQADHYNGLIAVWKEQGYTSHGIRDNVGKIWIF